MTHIFQRCSVPILYIFLGLDDRCSIASVLRIPDSYGYHSYMACFHMFKYTMHVTHVITFQGMVTALATCARNGT
jgi:hypothetical protein